MSAIYTSIVRAVQENRLREPFTILDFRNQCGGFAHNTYSTFLAKHRVGNPGGCSEMFVQVSSGKYMLKRPFLQSRLLL
jgi:hypothetical protein